MVSKSELLKRIGALESTIKELTSSTVTDREVQYRFNPNTLCPEYREIETERLTIKGEVEAIKKHLGINIEVKQSSLVPSEVVVSKKEETKKGKK